MDKVEKPKRVNFSTTIDETILEDLKIAAIKQKKSINELLEEILTKHLYTEQK